MTASSGGPAPEGPAKVGLATRIILVRPLQPGNVGSVARVMANFGFHDLVLVDPSGFDPDQARWMAPGAHALVDGARFKSTVAEALEGCSTIVATTARLRRWKRQTLEPAEAARALMDAGGAGALLFGPEDKGLAGEDLALADAIVTIPTSGLESLNLSHAVAVLLHAMHEEARRRGEEPDGKRRQRARGGGKSEPKQPTLKESRADASKRAALVEEAMKALDEARYLATRAPEQTRTTLYDLLSRAEVSDKEVSMLHGMLKKLSKR